MTELFKVPPTWRPFHRLYLRVVLTARLNGLWCYSPSWATLLLLLVINDKSIQFLFILGNSIIYLPVYDNIVVILMQAAQSLCGHIRLRFPIRHEALLHITVLRRYNVSAISPLITYCSEGTCLFLATLETFVSIRGHFFEKLGRIVTSNLRC